MSLGGFDLQDVLLLLLQQFAHHLVPGRYDNCLNKKHHPNYPTPPGFAHSWVCTRWRGLIFLLWWGNLHKLPAQELISELISLLPLPSTLGCVLGKGTSIFYSLSKVCQGGGWYYSLFCSSRPKTETMWTNLHDTIWNRAGIQPLIPALCFEQGFFLAWSDSSMEYHTSDLKKPRKM